MISVRRQDILTSVIAGLTAGTLDIGAAGLIHGVGPGPILQAIAAGLLGRSAFVGGLQTAMLGLILQWAMSCVIAAIYVIPTRRWAILSRRWVTSGLVFGIAIFVVMNFVVVPLSAVHKVPTFTVFTFVENLTAMLAFGVIVSGITHWRSG